MSETESYAGAAVIAPHPAAASAARDILVEGGNAIEAAVAALAVVSVVLPETGGAGGDGVWLVREAGARGRTRVLDARGPVGDAVTPKSLRERHLDAIPAHGPLSILTVPGAVAGWRAALELSKTLGGRVPGRQLLESAVASGRNGFAAPDPRFRLLPPGLADDPVLAEPFLIDGKRLAAGSLLRAAAWAEALAYLAQTSLDDFYRGDVGREIAHDLDAMGGLVTRNDFRRFEPRWREPTSFRCGLGVVEATPSRAAMKLLVSLGIVETLVSGRPDSAAHLHLRIEAMKRAEALIEEAQEAGGDPALLLLPATLQGESLRIDAARAAAGSIAHDMAEESLWVGVVDGAGLCVSVVQSIGTAFGSGCRLVKTGLVMGNRAAAFDLDDERDRLLRRGRRASLRALPIIVAGRQGQVRSLGASDWRVAASAMTPWLAGASLADSTGAPRALPDGSTLAIEENVDPSLLATLRRAGHDIRPLATGSAGEASAILRGPDGRLDVAADPRRDASCSGF